MYLFNTYNQMMYNTIYKKAIYDITMTDWLQKKDYKNTTKILQKNYRKRLQEKDYKKTAWTLLGPWSKIY